MRAVFDPPSGLKYRLKSLGKRQDFLERCKKKGDPELIAKAELLVKEYEKAADDWVKRHRQKRT